MKPRMLLLSTCCGVTRKWPIWSCPVCVMAMLSDSLTCRYFGYPLLFDFACVQIIVFAVSWFLWFHEDSEVFTSNMIIIRHQCQRMGLFWQERQPSYLSESVSLRSFTRFILLFWWLLAIVPPSSHKQASTWVLHNGSSWDTCLVRVNSRTSKRWNSHVWHSCLKICLL
jgi:hypothetical protein